LCFLNVYFWRSVCFTNATSATIAWDAVHTLLRLLAIYKWSSFHHCVMECLFSFENGPEIETAPNARLNFSEIPLTYGIKTVPWYIVWRTISCRRLHYRVNEFFWVFIKHKIMSYVFNFVVEIFLFLSYDLRSADQTMNDSPFLHYVDSWTWSADNGQYEYVSGILLWSILDPTSWPKRPQMEGNH
jgi:hypothetical protein